MLKAICNKAKLCKAKFDAVDSKIKVDINYVKENLSDVKKNLSNIENKLDQEKHLSSVINAVGSLIDTLDSIIKYKRKSDKLISLYDPRVIDAIGNLVKKLRDGKDRYMQVKNELNELWKESLKNKYSSKVSELQK